MSAALQPWAIGPTPALDVDGACIDDPHEGETQSMTGYRDEVRVLRTNQHTRKQEVAALRDRPSVHARTTAELAQVHAEAVRCSPAALRRRIGRSRGARGARAGAPVRLRRQLGSTGER